MLIDELFLDERLDEAFPIKWRHAAAGLATAASLAGMTAGGKWMVDYGTKLYDKERAAIELAMPGKTGRDGVGNVSGRGEQPLPASGPSSVEREKFASKTAPVVAEINRGIASDRERIEEIIDDPIIDSSEQSFLNSMMDRYGVPKEEGHKGLLNHVAPVPPSIVLAKTAQATGWGKSAGGATPDATARSVARQLNADPAYAGFRQARAGGERDALELARTLPGGAQATRAVRDLMMANDLTRFDN